jgi:hypothetical protein
MLPEAREFFSIRKHDCVQDLRVVKSSRWINVLAQEILCVSGNDGP